MMPDNQPFDRQKWQQEMDKILQDIATGWLNRAHDFVDRLEAENTLHIVQLDNALIEVEGLMAKIADNLLPIALAEIERLEAENKRLSDMEKIRDLMHDQTAKAEHLLWISQALGYKHCISVVDILTEIVARDADIKKMLTYNNEAEVRIQELEVKCKYLGERWIGQAAMIQDYMSKLTKAKEAMINERVLRNGEKTTDEGYAPVTHATDQLKVEHPELFSDA
jgi:hypothetical protein